MGDQAGTMGEPLSGQVRSSFVFWPSDDSAPQMTVSRNYQLTQQSTPVGSKQVEDLSGMDLRALPYGAMGSTPSFTSAGEDPFGDGHVRPFFRGEAEKTDRGGGFQVHN